MSLRLALASPSSWTTPSKVTPYLSNSHLSSIEAVFGVHKGHSVPLNPRAELGLSLPECQGMALAEGEVRQGVRGQLLSLSDSRHYHFSVQPMELFIGLMPRAGSEQGIGSSGHSKGAQHSHQPSQ